MLCVPHTVGERAARARVSRFRRALGGYLLARSASGPVVRSGWHRWQSAGVRGLCVNIAQRRGGEDAVGGALTHVSGFSFAVFWDVRSAVGDGEAWSMRLRRVVPCSVTRAAYRGGLGRGGQERKGRWQIRGYPGNTSEMDVGAGCLTTSRRGRGRDRMRAGG